MRVTPLMIVTALVETGTGLLLLVWPALVFVLLLGWRQAAPETLLIGRVAGAGVIGIGVASWPARHDHDVARRGGGTHAPSVKRTTAVVDIADGMRYGPPT